MRNFNHRPLPGLCINGVIGKVYKVIDKADKDSTETICVNRALGDKLLDVTNVLTGAPYQLIDEETGASTLPCSTWLEEGLNDGSIVEIDARMPLARPREILGADDAKRLDPKCEARLIVLRGIYARGLNTSTPNLSSAISEIWSENSLGERFGERPSTRSVRGWMSRVDIHTVEMGDLVSLSGRVPRARRLDPEVWEIIERECDNFFGNLGTGQRDALSDVVASIGKRNLERLQEGLPPLTNPSRETIRRTIGSLCNRERYARKYGEQAARKNWDGAGLSLVAHAIGELGMIDDTTLDVIVLDHERGFIAGRPNICVLIDIATRCIVGINISFEAPSASSALATVRNANALKAVNPARLERYHVLRRINCRFSEILCDNGANYVSRSFTEGMADIGTTITFARVGRGTDKNFCERFFNTLRTLLLNKLAGYTATPRLLREFGLNPESAAILTLSELIELINEALYVYHITTHSGIGMQPAFKWQKLLETTGRSVFNDLARVEIMLRETLYDVTLTRTGIIKDGIRYTHPVHGAQILRSAGAQRVGLANDNAMPEDATTFVETVDGSIDTKQRQQRHRKTKPAGLGNEQATAVVKIKRDRSNLLMIYAQDPVTLEYLEFTAANEAYADGLSLAMHKACREYATKANLAFNTEEEQLIARSEMIERIRSIAPDLDARGRLAAARVLGQGTEVLPGIEEAFAEPRHDGLDSVIGTHSPAEDRRDANRKSSRPRKGGIRGAKGSQGKMPDVDDGDEPLAPPTPLSPHQLAVRDVIGRADNDDDHLWEDYA